MQKFRFYALWLSLICIILFIIQTLIPGFTESTLLLQEKPFEIWRFVTSMFVHGDIIHLMYNLFALALFGSILEKVIGSKKFLLVFFASGIFANFMALNFYSASLGASGAIYGILGALTIMRPGMYVWAFGFPMPMFIAALLWIGAGVLGLFMPSNTGHIAHLSGIAIGFIFGIIYRLANRKKIKEKRIEINEQNLTRWENSCMLKR